MYCIISEQNQSIRCFKHYGYELWRSVRSGFQRLNRNDEGKVRVNEMWLLELSCDVLSVWEATLKK